MSQEYLVVDYETGSEYPIKHGLYGYLTHKSTFVRGVAWRRGTKETLRKAKTKTWFLHKPSGYGEFINSLLDPKVKLVAHNAAFEQGVTKYVLPKILNRPGLAEIPTSRWICTAAMAASHALPRKLKEVGAVLNLDYQKDKEGDLLIRRHCVPQKLSEKRAVEFQLGNKPEHYAPTPCYAKYWNNDPEGLDRLAAYCARDVDTEVELFLTLPELRPEDYETWLLDQKINQRGVYCDRKLVDVSLSLIAEAEADLKKEFRSICGGAVNAPSERDKLLNHLVWLGCSLPNLQAKTVADALETGLATGKAKRLLEIRQSFSKTSTKKFIAFKRQIAPDSRLRDLLLYWGASTGRFSGRGVQVQNFPRGTLKDADTAVEVILENDIEWLKAMLGDPMAALSSVLRSVLRATPGYRLYCADYAAIEARVLFWIAKHDAGLQGYREGRDLYREIAAVIYGVPLDKVTKEQREVGKRAILGSGYGMGHKKFRETCKQFGVEVSEKVAKLAVDTYRKMHAPVPKLWSNLEMAAIAAVKNPGKRYRVNRTAWYMSGKFLYCELPSGRRLAYYGAHVKKIKNAWGNIQLALFHYGVGKNKKWLPQKTWGGTLTENVVQATAACLMFNGMKQAEKKGYDILITVHDEILAEHQRGDLEEFNKLISTLPVWAEGLPLKAEAWEGERYKKG